MSYRRQSMTSLITLLVAIGLAYLSFSPNGGGYLFPKIVSGAMVTFAAFMVIATFLSKSQSVADSGGERIPWGVALPTLFVLIGLLIVIEWLGFFATSFIAFYTIVLMYSPGTLKRQDYIKSASISAAFIAVLYAIFVLLLNVQIPHGLLL